VWVAVAALVIAAGIAAYFALGGARQETEPAAETEVAAAPEPAAQPLGTEAEMIEIPPLGEADPVVRQLVQKLSSHPQVLAWLTTDGLVRNFTVSVSNIAEGLTPSNHVQVLKPSGEFTVIDREDFVFVDPKSYARYNSLADAVSGIDADGAARLYTTLKPRLEEAYAELGFPDRSFDRAVEEAIVALLATPIPNDTPRLVSRTQGIGYAYADPRLEGLSGAQKQLLRMGPRNARIVQDSLRDIAIALGIPESRLPRPRD
jgi:hypothetical protein